MRRNHDRLLCRLALACVAGWIAEAAGTANGQSTLPLALPLMQQPVAASVAPPSDFDLRLQALEKEINNLKQKSTDTPPDPAGSGGSSANDSDAALDEPPADPPPAPTYPTFKVTGFFQLDWGFYDQDEVNRATLGDIEDGLGFRRARVAATGDVFKDTSYMMEFDFAQAQARFVDVWMQFAETPCGNIRIGRFRQPFGMTELTSIRELPFLERPTMFALSPFRQTGIMLSDTAFRDEMTWAISGYRYLTDNFGNVYADSGGYGTAARLTCLPLDRGDCGLIHLGVDYSFNDPGRDQVQFLSTNEFFVGQNPNLALNGLSVLPIVAVPPFVNTGIMSIDHTNLFNLEAAVSLGRALVQSEFRWAVAEQLSGVSNTFPAWYVDFRYMLTGEVIPYNRKAGVFSRVKPLRPCDLKCGYLGAWEAAAHVSYIDLDGIDLPGPGRHLTNTTGGLNWYLNERTKFQFEWIHSFLSDLTLGNSDADTFAMRAQIDY